MVPRHGRFGAGAEDVLPNGVESRVGTVAPDSSVSAPDSSVFSPVPVEAPAESVAAPRSRAVVPAGPSPGGSALRSMILPGWGQAKNGAWLKSGAFFAAYTGMLGWAVRLNQDKQDAESRLRAAAGSADEAFWRSETSRLEDARNGKVWLGGLVLLLAMAEAYVDAHLYRFEERIAADVAVRAGADGPEARVGVTVLLGERERRGGRARR